MRLRLAVPFAARCWLPRGGRARKGWRSARRFDGLSRRCLSGLTRAGRHCGVVAAPPDLCAGVCSRDGGRGAPSRGVRGAVPCDQIGRWRAARGDELRLMEPFTPPAPSRWSLCAEAGRLSPFGGPIDIWAKSVSRCHRLFALSCCRAVRVRVCPTPLFAVTQSVAAIFGLPAAPGQVGLKYGASYLLPAPRAGRHSIHTPMDAPTKQREPSSRSRTRTRHLASPLWSPQVFCRFLARPAAVAPQDGGKARPTTWRHLSPHAFRHSAQDWLRSAPDETSSDLRTRSTYRGSLPWRGQSMRPAGLVHKAFRSGSRSAPSSLPLVNWQVDHAAAARSRSRD